MTLSVCSCAQGHGPYSHVFEREFLRRRGITEWEHEAMSADMLDFIIDDNHLEAVSPDDVKRVKALITAAHEGAPSSQSLGLAPWLTDIVANGRNSIDVDKFDYLARDALYCGAYECVFSLGLGPVLQPGTIVSLCCI